MDTLKVGDLDGIYNPPTPQARDKALDHVDNHGRRFINLSPFCIIGAAGSDGSLDVSPRGGEPGFVHVNEDGRALFLPDRSGNNRLDTLRNILGGSGQIGMMFMIPGFDDIYRVNGRAAATNDKALIDRFIEIGKPPRLILRIDVDEAFIHCPKALMRAKLWKPDARVARDRLPTVAEMIADHMKLSKQPVTLEQIIDNYKAQF